MRLQYDMNFRGYWVRLHQTANIVCLLRFEHDQGIYLNQRISTHPYNWSSQQVLHL